MSERTHNTEELWEMGMGYESLVLPVGDWKLQIDHNDVDTTISIINENGEYRFIRISRAQAQELKRHLDHTLPIDFENGKR